MVMAAGLGTRLRPFTSELAKPLLPVLGVPMAQFALDQLANAGVKRVVANVHHFAKETIAGLRALDLYGMELVISDESSELMGSAGGLRKALPLLGDGPFYLLNADVLSDIPLSELALFHAKARESFGAKITFALSPGVSGQDQYREFFADPRDGRVNSVGQKASGRPFWTGAAVIEPEALSHVPSGSPAEFVPSILEPAVSEKKAAAVFSSGAWYDIGSPDLWWKAHLEILRKMETGRIPVLWRDRIEKTAVRLTEGIWTTEFWRASPHFSRWVPPCFWGGDSRSKPKAPRSLGPRAILYGDANSDQVYENGIGFRGMWVNLR